MNFNELNLNENLQKMLKTRGFSKATPIQEKAVPKMLEGSDVVGLSQTGTGKTLAFVLPILQNVEDSDGVQALVLAPTRELAQQTKKEFQISASNLKNVKSVAVFGGADINQQIFALKKKPQIVVGTPGRVLDHIRRHTLKLKNLRFLVLDEADEMFNMGFRTDILKIIEKLPTERQTFLFSATMNNEVLDLAKNYMKNPEQILIGTQNSTTDAITQTYFLVPKDKKKKAFHALLMDVQNGKTLVFCNTKKMVGMVQSYIEKFGFKIAVLHGDMPQSQRNEVMKGFKSGKYQILVTTDVAARGIDAPGILNVINFDFPENLENYVHRIGRCGRAGNKGFAYSILNSKEQEQKILMLSKKLKCKINLGFVKLSNLDDEKPLVLNKKPQKFSNKKFAKKDFKQNEAKTNSSFKKHFAKKDNKKQEKNSKNTSKSSKPKFLQQKKKWFHFFFNFHVILKMLCLILFLHAKDMLECKDLQN